MKPVRVLARVHEAQDVIGIEMLRQGQLHDVSGDRGVLVEALDLLVELALRRVFGQVKPDRPDADLGAVPVLSANVGVAAGIVADEHRGQPWEDIADRQCLDSHPQVRLHRGRGGPAVQDRGCHAVILPSRCGPGRGDPANRRSSTR